MGEKGARLGAAAKERAAQVVDEWAPLGAVRSKAMFGGYGVFIDDLMFAIIDSEGTLFLKADESTEAEHEAAGATKHGRMPYWTVPDAVADDEDTLRTWAGRSADLARA